MERNLHTVTLVFLLGAALLLDLTQARTPRDCEEIDLEHISDDSISSTFSDSFMFSIYSPNTRWDASADMVDANGTRCTLIFKRDGGEKMKLGINCDSIKTNSGIQENVLCFNNNWIDLLINTNECPSKQAYSDCQTYLVLAIRQLLSVKTYRSQWIETPLLPPLTITWDKRATGTAQLVVNCQNKDCLVSRRKLDTPKLKRKYSFWLKMENKTEFTYFIEISATPGFLKGSVSLNQHSHTKINSWTKVTVEWKNGSLQFLLDGEHIHERKNIDSQTKFEFREVELLGEGLLTWCDPHDGGEVEAAGGYPWTDRKPLDSCMPALVYWTLGVLIIAVIVLSTALICVCMRSRGHSSTSLELLDSEKLRSPKDPAAAGARQDYPPKCPQPLTPSAFPPAPAPWTQEEAIYEAVEDMGPQSNNNIYYESRNSLYGEF